MSRQGFVRLLSRPSAAWPSHASAIPARGRRALVRESCSRRQSSLLARSAARSRRAAPLACWAAGVALRLRTRGAAHSHRERWAARAFRDGHIFGRFGGFCVLRVPRRPLGLCARAAWLRAGAWRPLRTCCCCCFGVDNDSKALETYKANFPEAKVKCASVGPGGRTMGESTSMHTPTTGSAGSVGSVGSVVGSAGVAGAGLVVGSAGAAGAGSATSSVLTYTFVDLLAKNDSSVRCACVASCNRFLFAALILSLRVDALMLAGFVQRF